MRHLKTRLSRIENNTRRCAIVVTALICFTLVIGCGGMRSSREFAQAKDALNKQEWSLAKQLLGKEVLRDSLNREAWYYLGVACQRLGDIHAMNAAYARAETGLSDEFALSMSRSRFAAWAEDFNAGVATYNRFADNGDTVGVSKAIVLMKRAKDSKPDYPENCAVLGMLYEARRDTLAFVAEYESYMRLQMKAMDFARIKGLYIGMNRSEAIAKLGSPSSSTSVLSGYDSLITDAFIGNDAVYLSSIRRDSTFVVEGWRVNPPVGWTKEEKERYAPFNTRPLVQLAAVAYAHGDLDRALGYTESIVAIRPEDEQAQGLRVQIHNESGHADTALALLEGLVERNPENKSLRCNLALAMLRLERYDDAVVQYRRVLELDPGNEIAILNCAAALKNKAIAMQRSEKLVKSANSGRSSNQSSSLDLLNAAAELFERYKALPEHTKDVMVYEHLVNIYEVTGNEAQLSRMLRDMESVEQDYADSVRYWELLGGVYSRVNRTDSAERAYRKAREAKARTK